MRTINCTALFILISFCSCKNTGAQTTSESTVEPPKELALPTIPGMYTSPEQRAEYLAMHFWDLFNFADTGCIDHPAYTEQAWANYIDILNHVPIGIGQQSMLETMNRAGTSKPVLLHFADLAEKYLYEPNSPYRNEEFYIPVLEFLSNASTLDETEKTRPKYRLELAQKNRVGTKATDFAYTLNSGKQGSLYNIKAEYTLIYFNNPGCHACEEITTGLKSSMPIQLLLSDKRLTILSIYPDEDLDEWKKHLKSLPAEWINAYDKGGIIKRENSYDLKAIPTLYLLDKNKHVLLKDATLPAIEEFLIAR